MCGKTHGVGKDRNRLNDPNDPMTLLERLLNDPNRRWLLEDPGRGGQFLDPYNPPPPRNDPNDGSNPDDPGSTGFPRDPGGPGTAGDPGGPRFPRDPGGPGGRRDPGGPGTNRDPGGPGTLVLDPGGPGGRRPGLDPTVSGGDGPRNGDIYTGGTSGLASTEPRDRYTGGVQTSGLAGDPTTAGVDRVPPTNSRLLPAGTMLTRAAAVDYLTNRRPDLASALRPSFA